MKIAIVTSEVTYIPYNYNKLILALVENHSVSLLVNLKNKSPMLYLKGIVLYLYGAKKIGAQLIKNNFFTRSTIRKETCQAHNVEFLEANSMNEPQIIQELKNKKIDIILNIRTRCIYKEEALKLTKLGCINLHHGILPNYRGTMCDLYAIEEGRKPGFTIHKMEKKVDAGLIFETYESNYQGKDYWEYLSLSHKDELIKINELISFVQKNQQLPNGTINSRNKDTTYTKNPSKQKIKEMLKKGMIL